MIADHSSTSRRLLVFGLFLLLLAVAGAGATAFIAHAPSFYGTARAPHSDALSWLFGSLGFYFYGSSHNVLLLRPSIGVMFASIQTLAGDIAAIPKVFAGLYAVALLTAFWLNDLRGRLALILLATLLWTGRGALMQPLSPDSLNTDFPAFAFTFAGLLSVLAVMTGRRTQAAGTAVLAAGYLLLGMAAAIRGPFLMIGPVLLLLTLGWSLLADRRMDGEMGDRQQGLPIGAALRTTAVALAAFCLPIIGDSLLRANLGLDAQGPIAFYSFYSDPTHTLTNEAYFRYVELKPTSWEVMREYVAFLLSSEGQGVMLGALLERLKIDGDTLVGVGAFRLLAAAFLIDAVARLASWRHSDIRFTQAIPPIATMIKLALVLVAFAGTATVGWLTPQQAVLALLGLTLVWALPAGRVVPAAFALTYILGLLFVVLTGTKYYSRIAHTFIFALSAAPLWVVLDPGPVVWNRVHRAVAVGAAGFLVAGLLVLLTANSVVPTPMKAVYRAEVMGRSAAIKIADDPRLNRSLYFSGRREMLYTHLDALPVGTVRRYTAFDNPNGPIGVPEEIEGLRAFNALFNTPGSFVD